MRKMSEFGVGISKKIDNFLRQNAYVMTIGLVLFFLYVFLKFGSLYEKNHEILDAVKKDLGSVIFLTADGQVIKMKKTPVNYADERISLYIANTIYDKLIKDLTTISHGFTRKFSSPEDLYKNTPDFKLFHKNFDGNDYTLTFAKYLYKLILEDELPETISPYAKKIIKYQVYKNDKGETNFDIVYEVKMVTRQWLKELPDENKWVSKKATSRIVAHGVFDIAKYGSIDNPFGIKIYIDELPVPTKRRRQ